MASEILKSSEEVIKKKIGETSFSGVFVAPFNETNFSEKKLMNACKFIGKDINAMNVVAFIDTTLFNSAKEGILFTGTTLFYKIGSQDGSFSFENISKAEYEIKQYKDSNGNTQEMKNVYILFNDNKDLRFHTYRDDYNRLIVDIINAISEEAETIDSTEQLVQLNDLGDDVISVYLKIIMNYLKEDDEIISPNEYKELIGIMTRLNIKPELSDSLRQYRLEEGKSEKTEDLVDELIQNVPGGSRETILQALSNDLLAVRRENLDNWKNDADFIRYKELIHVSDQQVEFFVRKLKQDESIINDKIDDNTIKKSANELAAVGGAAGVSLAALAVTGGVSTGVWGGLLTLSMASTGGMLFGLAAIAGVGYASYKGIKYFSGTSELEKYGIRMSMLQEKIEQMQQSQNYLIDDLNWTSTKIGELLTEKDKILENFDKIQRLLKLNRNLKDSSKVIANDGQKNQREVYLAQVPSVLDVAKCNELISRTRYAQEFKEFIYNFYEVDEAGKYCLKSDLDDNIIEKLYKVMNQIGYYDTTQALSAQGTALVNKGKEKLKGFFS